MVLEGRPAGVPRRFHGTANIDAQDPIQGFADVVQNVVEHFTAQYGTEVVLTLEVEARSREGFDAKTVRIVRENAVTLRFETADFEQD